MKYNYYLTQYSHTLYRESQEPQVCEYLSFGIWVPSCRNQIQEKHDTHRWKPLTQAEAHKLQPSYVPVPTNKIKYKFRKNHKVQLIHLSFYGLKGRIAERLSVTYPENKNEPCYLVQFTHRQSFRRLNVCAGNSVFVDDFIVFPESQLERIK